MTLKDLRLFEKWEEHGNVPMTSLQLADIVGKIEPALLRESAYCLYLRDCNLENPARSISAPSSCKLPCGTNSG